MSDDGPRHRHETRAALSEGGVGVVEPHRDQSPSPCHGRAPCGRINAMSDTQDITTILRRGLPALRARWPIRELALFGSRVRDDATPGSDLDVLVTFERPIPLSSFLALEQELGAMTGLRVDLVSSASLKPYMGERIRAEAVAL